MSMLEVRERIYHGKIYILSLFSRFKKNEHHKFMSLNYLSMVCYLIQDSKGCLVFLCIIFICSSAYYSTGVNFLLYTGYTKIIKMSIFKIPQLLD